MIAMITVPWYDSHFTAHTQNHCLALTLPFLKKPAPSANPADAPPTKRVVPWKVRAFVWLRRGTQWREVISLVVIMTITLLMWNTWAVYPLKLLVAFFHEFSQGLMALLTGGHITSISFSNDLHGNSAVEGGLHLGSASVHGHDHALGANGLGGGEAGLDRRRHDLRVALVADPALFPAVVEIGLVAAEVVDEIHRHRMMADQLGDHVLGAAQQGRGAVAVVHLVG